MTDFLLELRCEEIPARMQAKASADLERMFSEKLAEAGLKAQSITSFVTPRRMALIASGLPMQTEAVSEERKGPRADAPEKALEGFLRSTGLTRDQLVEREDNKGNKVLFAVIEKPGRATADVLAEAIPAIVRAFPWPKSMRWGDASATTESLRWVRPLQGVIALLGDTVVPMEVDGVVSGNQTAGHRFHSEGAVTVTSAADYAEKLRDAYVIVDQEERKSIIESRARALAEDAGYALIEDKGLVAENAGLTEWPVPLLGQFDPDFLEVPPEVIQLTLRINQKYFVLRDKAGKLAPAFICTSNIEAKDGGKAIVEGNGKVLAARLSDARFFWELDKKTSLEEHAKKLERITFHEKLGTVADKVERVAKLARWLVEEGIVKPAVRVERSRDTDSAPDRLSTSLETNGAEVARLATLAEQAARLCKADLVTEMVGEFPELQGLMGGYYARAEGLPDAVADAIRDHYKPVGQGDEVPTAPVTVAVSLADKLDTLTGFFFIDEKPTGSKDPFALRRVAIGILSLTQYGNLRMDTLYALATATLTHVFASVGDVNVELGEVYEQIASWHSERQIPTQLSSDLLRLKVERANEQLDLYKEKSLYTCLETLYFLTDRLKVQQKEAGVRHDLIDAVFALGGEDDLVRLLARVHALQAFITTDDGVNLLAGYKRAANILKKEVGDDVVMPAQAGISGDGAQPTEASAFAGVMALSYTPEPAEAALITALDGAEPKAAAAIEAEDFEGAMAALATLRAPIDAFFEDVTVNDENKDKRSARLALLQRVRVAVHKVADFSKIAG